jgi:hypothetical protein
MECSSTSTKSSLHRRARNNGQGLGFKGFWVFLFTYQNQVGGPGERSDSQEHVPGE